MATDYKSLKVVDLKAKLKRLGLPQNGLKAELVARLEAAAAADESVASNSPEPTVEEPTGTVSDNAQPSEAPEAVQSIQPEAEPKAEPKEAEPEEAELEPEPEPEPQAAPLEDTESTPTPATTQGLPVTAAGDTPAQAALEEASSSDATPLQPTEVVQDVQKRKRRSQSPQPSGDEVARKRPRQDQDKDKEESKKLDHDLNLNSNLAAADTQAPEIEMKDGEEEEAVAAAPIHQPEKNQEQNHNQQNRDEDKGQEQNQEQNQEKEDHKAGPVAEKAAATDSAPPPTAAIQNGHPTTDDAMDAEPTHQDTASHQPDTTYPAEIERDVEPSIHPATSALYIKNFMRPLRAQTVKDHLLQLATPAGAPIDDNTVVDFYFDSIRTHAFAVFSSISAASRVRTALHGRIYPDETNRKPLWVDFIPPNCFTDWVDMEQGSGGGRGSSSRFEVTYSNDHDGNVTARLEESGSAPPPAKSAPQFERKASNPTGPSRPSGIENAPLGPRGFQPSSRGGPAAHPTRQERVVDQPLSTHAHPTVTYQPVSEELAKRRLDALSAAKAKDRNQDFGKDYNRYYFEHGDRLVDRGPEIFLGIRPPHRERERRREQGRRPPRDNRSFRRGPPPSAFAPHGVPRGGDRFRPPGSSASAFDDRPRYGGGRRNGHGRY
ncbi:hypothetical protein F4810DRAFT_497627 [Camillea tinctor]|nr:hypothetical protein F4810DRAFT_497627 [Camillea tinctor]